MPRKIPTDHRHEPPGTQDHIPTLVLDSNSRDMSQNDERIAALERQFADFDASVPVVLDDDHNEQRFAAMAKQISNLREQVEAVKALPRLSSEDVSSLSTALNTRVTSMIEKAITQEVTQLKIRINSMERTSAPTLAKDVEMLGNIVSETGKLVASLDERGRMLEAEVGEAKAAFDGLRREFNRDLSNSLRAVVETLQGEHA